MVKLGSDLLRIAHGQQIDMMAYEKAIVGGGVFIHADGKDGQVGPIMVKPDQGRCFLDAGRTITKPEIK